MRVLVTIDGLAGQEEFIGEILGQPWPSSTRFDLLFVSAPGAKANGGSSLEAAREALSAGGFLTIHHHREGSPVHEILTAATELESNLILAGDRRRSSLSRFLLGSVSTALLRHAHANVQIVRPRLHDYRAIQNFRVLIATDGSPASLRAARAVAARPWPPGTEARIVSAIDLSIGPTLTLLKPSDESFSPHPEDFEEARHEANSRINAVREILSPTGLILSEEITLSSGNPREALLEAATHWGPDLIFLGTHGKGPLDRILLGSVSEAIATHAPCSVEIVR
ncbi:MAG: universal stress protein [Bryobacter sp.]|jgi:nucleotide-binding universal stress UspA family protein|nr:universal stress protein [Bryobacter sp. CoA8 C33]